MKMMINGALLLIGIPIAGLYIIWQAEQNNTTFTERELWVYLALFGLGIGVGLVQ